MTADNDTTENGSIREPVCLITEKNKMEPVFTPQRYKIADERMIPFIDPEEIRTTLSVHAHPTLEQVETVLAKSRRKERLSLDEAAILVNAASPGMTDRIKTVARELKREIYGNRIVLFAPLYIGNRCTNNCLYCGFRSSNTATIRRTLSDEEIVRETRALEDNGHKRLILVYGEHPAYDAEYIAHTVRTVYRVKSGNGEIRRVNINAAPFDIEGFRTIKAAGIGTFQIFQETYDPEIYDRFHLSGAKRNYAYRLTALDRALEAGIDDVGIGALFGLGDWRFELLALLRHVNHLEACYGIGPHTISFPRIKEAQNVDASRFQPLNDTDFIRMIAILRLAVPYTGLILTARESEKIRKEAMEFGVSQIDGGSKIEIGGYARNTSSQEIEREQFRLNDERSLQQIIADLTAKGYIPSFCTACYRKGRTGEHFMEFSVPGFIKRFCTPNGLLTFAEYLCDYAEEPLKKEGWTLIEKELEKLDDSIRTTVAARLEMIRHGQRDLYL